MIILNRAISSNYTYHVYNTREAYRRVQNAVYYLEIIVNTWFGKVPRAILWYILKLPLGISILFYYSSTQSGSVIYIYLLSHVSFCVNIKMSVFAFVDGAEDFFT